MKSNLLLIVLFLGKLLSAQTFSQVSQTIPFDGVRNSSAAFSDVDGDGDQDVLITGTNAFIEAIAKLYINDGGSFTEVLDTPFDGVWGSTVTFSDVDGDGDGDVLITGENGSEERVGKLYTNDGGSFTEVSDTPFEGVRNGSVAFSDVDGDGDQDLLITGENGSEETIAKLYTNEEGSFTEAVDTPFDGVGSGSVAFSDVDGDGDEDVLITGENSSEEHIAKLYTNNGGSFTEVTDTPFDGVDGSSVAFSDVDNDGDKDVIITGLNNSLNLIAKLYTNSGGSFTEAAGTPFEGVSIGSVAFSDVDGDGDKDVLITGLNNPVQYITKLYTNDGGSFTEVADTPFDGVATGSGVFSDMDGDGDKDVLITGLNNSSERIAKLYTNDLLSSLGDLVNVNSFDFILYPNPAKASNLNIRHHSKENRLVTIRVFDMNGRLLKQQQEQAGIGQQTFLMDITSLSKGNYFVQLDDDKRKGIRKILVQ